mmetsp:Transcript_8173/g.20523  ORF Transcript_8173/g.20523 Transcript_8173/m.20523 type:complete len:1003 (-) Transcript_8173:34-3042(-)
MAAATAAGTSVVGAAGLYHYNRKNFLYDRKLRQEVEHNVIDFRVMQVELWREDIRDIIDLTTVKMDTYLILNTVQLGMCVMSFCEGRLSASTPRWLIVAHTLSTAGCFMYLLMSVWFSMHASVTAKSYKVRLLTHFVRLPIPTWSQLEACRTYASKFEAVEPRQMFRVPFLQGTQQSVLERGGVGQQQTLLAQSRGRSSSNMFSRLSRLFTRAESRQRLESSDDLANEADATAATDVWGLEASGSRLPELGGQSRIDPSSMRHFQLVHEATQYWQSYDGFARASMSLGTNHLALMQCDYVIAYVLVASHNLIVAYLVIGLFVTAMVLLILLDMSLTAMEFRVCVVLVALGPILALVACTVPMMHTSGLEVELSLMPFIVTAMYVTHALWLMFLLHICKVSENKGGALLPRGFRSVMYIDIFGWISQVSRRRRQRLAGAMLETGEEEEEGPIDHGENADLVLEFGSATCGGIHACERPPPKANLQKQRDGPALQSIQYNEYGQPVPFRPESLPGAAQPPESIEVNAEDFAPTTFVPAPSGTVAGSADPSFGRPGFGPWRIFWCGTVALILLWLLSGFATVLEISGWRYLKVEPILDTRFHRRVDEEHERDHWAKPTLSEGHLVSTGWPHTRVRPRRLTCGGPLGVDGGAWAIAATRSSMFAAQLPPDSVFNVKASPVVAPDERAGSRSNSSAGTREVAPQRVYFKETPICQDVEGHIVQDVAIHCNGNGAGTGSASPCHALVLHDRGEHLTPCAIHDGSSQGNSSRHSRAARAHKLASSSLSNLVAEWLQESASAEEVTSFAIGHASCHGNASCAYVQTTGRKIVELQAEHGAAKGGSWFPTRVLEKRGPAPLFETLGDPSALLSVAGNNGEYLMALHADKKVLEFISLKDRVNLSDVTTMNATGGGVRSAGRHWQLPPERLWATACSVGDNLYLLEDAASPQLWRFPLPAALRGGEGDSAKKTQAALLGVDAAAASMEASPPSSARERPAIRRLRHTSLRPA